MPKKGLLKKTLELNKNILDIEKVDPNSGISEEDRVEITAQINELTRKNRIDLSPEQLVLKPLKNGVVFPLAVNILALVLTGSVLWGLSTIFSERDAQYSRSGAALASAEGKLIQELKKDSESRLSEKDKEISDFQTRLSAMEKEQTNMQASFEKRLSSRENELRSQMEIELQKERERLLTEGLSEAIIEERLKKFEAERLFTIKKELDDFKSKLDSERTEAEANYARLRDEYKANISTLNSERKLIQDQSKKREDELRTSLEAKTRELETQSKTLALQATQATVELQQAQTELARIDEQRKKSVAAEDQIIGLYLTVRAALQDRRYEDAANGAATLQSFLTEPSLADIPSLQKRRQSDLFAADTLSRMARTELERASIDNTLLLNQAELISSIRTLTTEAKAALDSGKTEEANNLFRQALLTVPEVRDAFRYFTGRDLERDSVNRLQARAALTRATDAIEKGDYAVASSAYGEAASLLGLSKKEESTLIEGMAKLSVAQASGEIKALDTKTAQALINRAKKELDESRWAQSMTSYMQLLSGYPQAEQVPDALKGINAAFNGLSQEAETRAKENEKRFAEMQATLLAVNTASVVTTAKITELETALSEARKNTASAAGVPSAELQADIEALRAQNKLLASASQKYDTLVGSYSRYRSAEDIALSHTGSATLVDARAQLDAFLTEAETRRAFPDLKERIARYEKEFVLAGQKESIYNAITITENALRVKDAASRESYFQDVQSRFKGDADMQAFITALKRGLR